MENQFTRTAMLLGNKSLQQLQQKHVALFGVGGVGGYVAEALVRAGIGEISLFDHDIITQSNLNRQIIALHSTLGRSKVEVMAERLSDINPNAKIHANRLFYLPEHAAEVDFSRFDYIADCIDTIAAKVDLVLKAQSFHIPIISALGTGNKLHADRFEVADLFSTSVCPLARVMRSRLSKLGVERLKVVYSKEIPRKPIDCDADRLAGERRTVGSVSFCPPVAGLILAGEVLLDLAGIDH